MRRRSFLSASAATLATAALSACMGDPDNMPSSEGTPTVVPDDREAPTVKVPGGDPPSELQIEDLIPGGGAEAQPGDFISVHYVGVAWSNGEIFDSSWERGEPIHFPFGQGMVIQGWEEGLVGMKVGGRRRITIPADMGYGEQGAPPAIGPNETLIFVCDLVEVQSAS